MSAKANGRVSPEAASGSAETVYEALMQREPERSADQPLAVEVRPNRKKKQAGEETDARLRAAPGAGVAEAVNGLAEYLQPSQDVDYDWFVEPKNFQNILEGKYKEPRKKKKEGWE